MAANKTNRFDEVIAQEEKHIKKHVIESIVEDQPGVLQKIAGLFARRGFNIETITVGKTMQSGLSKMIIVVEGDDSVLEKVEKQMNKLIDTVKVISIPEKERIARELCLVKVNLSRKNAKEEVMNYANVYKTKIVDITLKTATIEIIGEPEKIDSFLDLMKQYGIADVSRTGITAIRRG